jgi:bis(5'-nucleosyl)-tetraphosphatase (symmetrical)
VANYAIGDIQGCYEPLMRLLERIHFNDTVDRLWFVGDLVNRGPQSLEVLRFIKSLRIEPRIVLGNHDLYLLTRLFSKRVWQTEDDTLDAIINAPDAEALGHWLRHQRVFYHDEVLQVSLCHAGIPPIWGLEEAISHARELENILQSDNFLPFLDNMYGNEPHRWSADLSGFDRLRIITNYFTRMRLCDAKGALILDKTIKPQSLRSYPWFQVPQRHKIPGDILFGHWAALGGHCPIPDIYALDTGCYWGGELRTLRLEDKRLFSVTGLASSP